MSQLNLNRPDELQRDCVDDFFEDFREAYEQCESVLIDLEQRPKEQELLNSIFRVVHTIKGNLGFIGLERTAQQPCGYSCIRPNFSGIRPRSSVDRARAF